MRKPSRTSLLLVLTVLLLADSALGASTQSFDASTLSESIDVQRYKPGPNATDILGVHGAGVGHGWSLGASFSYAHDLLSVYDWRSQSFLYHVVATQMTLDLMGSYACDRFELGMALPLSFQASQTGVPVPPSAPPRVDGGGVGDLRLVPKARLFSSGGWTLGAVLPVVLPTAGGKAFRGGEGLALEPQLVGEWAPGRGVRLVSNLGIHLRKQVRLRNLLVGNEWVYALGARVPLGERLTLQAQFSGALGLAEHDAEERPMEVLGSVEYRVNERLRLHVGGGPGLSHGYGTPVYRLFAGLGWLLPER